MFWTRYGRWENGCVLNNHGRVIYESAEAIKLRKAFMLSLEFPPLISNQYQVPQDTFESLVSEQRKGAWRG